MLSWFNVLVAVVFMVWGFLVLPDPVDDPDDCRLCGEFECFLPPGAPFGCLVLSIAGAAPLLLLSCVHRTSTFHDCFKFHSKYII